MVEPPFSIREPEGPESPVLVEVPHAGTSVDDITRRTLIAPSECIFKDADRFVDELYAGATRHGATLLAAHPSRYVVDLNRAESDVDGGSVRGVPGPLRATRGVVWRLTGDGRNVLSAPIEPDELERRLNEVYRPYHQTLARLIERKRARFGVCVVLAAHSMPSVGMSSSGRPGEPRADVVPGTRGRTSAHGSLIDAVDAFARSRGRSVAHDEPYRGGFTTVHYGRPDTRVHVVQVELARRLYMNEQTLEKHEGFSATADFCEALVSEVVRASWALPGVHAKP
jgi:N-formylglutamate amidohydrolase